MITLKVSGMSCQHCVKAVTAAVGEVDDAASVSIDLEAGEVAIESATPREKFVEAIEDAGYEVAA
ncbi:MAG: copper chaperone [Hyphomicrobiales bacterium]|nr:MAG: copper chaperone [Hyphomicrobiales bacterium]